MSDTSVDLDGLVLLVSSPLDLTLFSDPLRQVFLNSQRRDFMESTHLELSVPRSLSLFLFLSSIMSSCKPLPLFLYAAGESFSDEG